MPTFLDNLNSDLGWVKTGAYGDATAAFSNGAMTLTKGASYTTSAYMRSGFFGRNAGIKITTSGGTNGSPEIHLRETDQNNFLVARIDRAAVKFVIGKVVSGTYTEIASLAMANYTTSINYTFWAEVYEDCFRACLINDTANRLLELEQIDSSISAFTGTKHGLGLNGTSTAFDSVMMRTYDTLLNVVSVGDSNVGVNTYGAGSLSGSWTGTTLPTSGTNVMTARRATMGMFSRNRGVAGYSAADILAAKATLIDPYKVTGADNLIVISAGNGDYAYEDLTAAQAWVSRQSLMTSLKASGWRIVNCTIIPFSWSPQASTQTFVDTLNATILANTVADGYTSVDVHAAMGCTVGVNAVDPAELREDDNIHFTIKGRALWAKTVLRSIFNNERTPI